MPGTRPAGAGELDDGGASSAMNSGFDMAHGWRLFLGALLPGGSQAETWTVATDSPRTEFKRFRSEANGEAVAYRVARDSRGHVYAVGINLNVDNVGGERLGAVFRLNETDGSVDRGFQTGPSLRNTFALAVQPDDKVLATGIMGRVAPGFTTMSRINGLEPDTFVNSGYSFVAADPGRICVAGGFTPGNFTPGPVRLNSNGTVDSTFNPPHFAAESSGVSVARRNDGDFWAGGSFDPTAPGLGPR